MVEDNATEGRRVTVGELLMALRKKGSYELIAGGLRGLERAIGKKSVQRLGVSLTGHVEHLDPQRVQIIGRSESGYLAQCDPEARLDILTRLVETGFPKPSLSPRARPCQKPYVLSLMREALRLSLHRANLRTPSIKFKSTYYDG